MSYDIINKTIKCLLNKEVYSFDIQGDYLIYSAYNTDKQVIDVYVYEREE